MLRLLIALILTSVAAPLARAAESHYYVMMFAYKNHVDLRQAHTYATFMHLQSKDGVQADPEDSTAWDAEQVTISWLPAELPMCILCRPVTGYNYSLEGTFQIGLDAGADLYELPTIEVQQELFANAVDQVNTLASGAVEWVTFDRGTRPDAVNCLHAVSDVNRVSGPLYSGVANGVEGSREALGWFEAYRVYGGAIPTWLPAAMGVGNYPVSYVGD